MNGNIFNYSLAAELYQLGENCYGCLFGHCLYCSPYYAYAIPPAPPGNISTTGEPIFVQSYINAYNTAFNQPANPQEALNNYEPFSVDDINSDFIPGTFGYDEEYNKIGERFFIKYLTDSINNYIGIPYLFVSAGSGGGSGYMYLDWIIVTYGVPYVISIS